MPLSKIYYLILILNFAVSSICLASDKHEDDLEVKSKLLRPCSQNAIYDCVKVDVLLSINAQIDIVWQVITDYQHAPDFISNLKSSKQVTLAPNVMMVEQIGRVGWGLLKIEIKTLSKVILNPASKKIHSISVGGNLMTTTMSTELRSSGNGTSILEFSLITDPGPWAPLAISEQLLKRHALQSFNDLKIEILKRNSLNANSKL